MPLLCLASPSIESRKDLKKKPEKSRLLSQNVLNASKSLEISQNVPKHLEKSENIPECSKKSPNIPKTCHQAQIKVPAKPEKPQKYNKIKILAKNC